MPLEALDDFPFDDDSSIPNEDESWIDNGSVHSLSLDDPLLSSRNEKSSDDKVWPCYFC